MSNLLLIRSNGIALVNLGNTSGSGTFKVDQKVINTLRISILEGINISPTWAPPVTVPRSLPSNVRLVPLQSLQQANMAYTTHPFDEIPLFRPTSEILEFIGFTAEVAAERHASCTGVKPDCDEEDLLDFGCGEVTGVVFKHPQLSARAQMRMMVSCIRLTLGVWGVRSQRL